MQPATHADCSGCAKVVLPFEKPADRKKVIGEKNFSLDDTDYCVSMWPRRMTGVEDSGSKELD
jgi:hypothetical protein